MELRTQGKTLKEIGREVGLSESAVSRICAGKSACREDQEVRPEIGCFY